MIALAPEGPARPATAELLRHAADWGAGVVEVGPAPLLAGSPLLPLPAGAVEDHAPLTAVPPVALLAFALARRRGANPDRPDWIERYHSQGLTHILGRRGGDLVTRIVLVGAGSVEFTRNLLGDILSYPELRDAEIVLHDIDARPAADGRADGELDGRRARRDARDQRAASTGARRMSGADFVINTIQVGGARATQLDFDIPRRHGLALHDQRHDQRRRRPARAADDPRHARRSPRTWRTSARTRRSSTTRTRWACSSAPWTRPSTSRRSGCATRSTGRSTRWPATSAVPVDEVSSLSAGVEPPRLDPPPRAPGPRPVPGPRGVRGRRAGARRRPRPGGPVPPVRVLPDGVVRAPRRVQPVVHPEGTWSSAFHVPIGEYLDRVAHNLDEYEATKRRLDAGRAVRDRAERRVRRGDHPRDGVTGEPARIVANVLNAGPAGAGAPVLISNLAADACVEVPALVDGLGVHPTRRRRAAAAVRGLHAARRRLPGAHGPRGARRGPRPRLPRGAHRPHRPGPPHARRGVAHDRRADRGRRGVAPRLARGIGAGLARVEPEEEDHDACNDPRPRRCAASRRSAPSPRCSSAPAAAPRRPRPRRDRRAASPTVDGAGRIRDARRRRRPRVRGRGRVRDVRGSAGHDHLRDVGRHDRARQPAEDRRRLPGPEPEHHGQGHRSPTGTPTGPSCRPTSPAATRPTCS